MKGMTLALAPLDERPVNTRYPQMLGAIGGAEVLLPPPPMRGLQRVPADVDAVSAWLRETAKTADAAIVSCEYLGFGNLIASRITNNSAVDVLARLALLEQINPGCPVHAFSLITRVSNADDAVEEPDYWAEWGTAFYRYARLRHQAEVGVLEDADALMELEARLPADLKADWLTPAASPATSRPIPPGSINEGGELGYSLSHAYGAAFDNPGLLPLLPAWSAMARPRPGPWPRAGTRTSSSTRQSTAPCCRSSTSTATGSPGPPSWPASPRRSLTEPVAAGMATPPIFVEGDDPDAMHHLMAETRSTGPIARHQGRIQVRRTFQWFHPRREPDAGR